MKFFDVSNTFVHITLKQRCNNFAHIMFNSFQGGKKLRGITYNFPRFRRVSHRRVDSQEHTGSS